MTICLTVVVGFVVTPTTGQDLGYTRSSRATARLAARAMLKPNLHAKLARFSNASRGSRATPAEIIEFARVDKSETVVEQYLRALL